MQVVQVQVCYLHKWVEGITSPAQVAMGKIIAGVSRGFVPTDKREPPPNCMLLLVTTTTSTRFKGQGTRCKGQGQHQHKLEWDAASTCNSNQFHHRPDQNQRRHWWNARCSNHCNWTCMCKGTQFKFFPCPALTQVEMIAASCMHSTSTCADSKLVSGGGGWSCM